MLSSFRWILPGQLAGSGRPGLLDTVESDIAWLKAEGIRGIVSLTEDCAVGAGHGLRSFHFPIDDMHVPTPRFALEICERILGCVDEGVPVVVHCHAGLGRTGLIAACCLMTLGRSAQDALRAVRRVNPRYVQNSTQERFLEHFDAFLRSVNPGPEVTAGWIATIARHCDRLLKDPQLGHEAARAADPLTLREQEAALIRSGLRLPLSADRLEPVVDWCASSEGAQHRHSALLNATLGELGQAPLADARWWAIEQAAQL